MSSAALVVDSLKVNAYHARYGQIQQFGDIFLIFPRI